MVKSSLGGALCNEPQKFRTPVTIIIFKLVTKPNMVEFVFVEPKVGTNGNRTGGKTTNGQTNMVKDDKVDFTLRIAAGNSMGVCEKFNIVKVNLVSSDSMCQSCSSFLHEHILYNFSVVAVVTVLFLSGSFASRQWQLPWTRRRVQTPHLACTRAYALFCRAHLTRNDCTCGSRASRLKIDQCRAFLKTLSSLHHALVTCACHSFPSESFIFYLFSVTTLRLVDTVGCDQKQPLHLCSLEWNVWLANPTPHTCSSPKNALLVLLERPLLFPFPFPFLLFTWWPLNGLDCQAHSVSSHDRNMISRHQCSLARQSLHPWLVVQSRLQHSLPRWMFCSCCWRVRSRGVAGFPSSFSASQNSSTKHCSYWFSSVCGDIQSPKRKGTCESLSLSLSFT